MSVVYANNVSKGRVVSLIRTICSHNIENSIAGACGAAQPRPTTRRDFKYLQKEQPDIPRLWPFRATREALAYPHTRTHTSSRVREWQVYGAIRIKSAVSFVRPSSYFFSLSLSSFAFHFVFFLSLVREEKKAISSFFRFEVHARNGSLRTRT